MLPASDSLLSRALLILFVLITPCCFSQAWLDKMEKAESLYGKHAYVKALSLGEEAYALWKVSPDTTLQTKLYIHGVLELMYETTGFYGKAEDLYYQDLKSLDAAGKKETPVADGIKLSLAELYVSQGRYDQADFYIHELIGNGRSSPTSILNTYQKLNANVRFFLGDVEAAEKMYRQLLQKQRAIDKEHPEYATEVALLSQNLAIVYDELKRYRESDSLYQVALHIAENVYGEQGQLYSTILSNLGSLYLRNNRLDEAEGIFTRVLRLKEKSVTKNHPEYAIALRNLGRVNSAKRNFAKARHYYQQALAITDKAFKSRGSEYMNLLELLAEAEASENDHDAADKHFAALLSLKIAWINDVFSFLSEKEKSEFYFSTQDSFNKFRKYAWERSEKAPHILEDVMDLQLKTKGWLFTQQARIRHALATTDDPQLKSAYHQWRERKQLLINAIQNPLFTDEDRQILEKEIGTLEKRISSLTKVLENPIHWKHLRSLLKPGEAAIEIFQTTDNGTDGRYGALLFTNADSLPRLLNIGTIQELDGRNFRFYQNSIRQKLQDSNSFGVYWKKIANELTGVMKVFVSGDGVYQKINLNTLFNPASGKYLIDELQIISLTNLLEIDVESVAATTKSALLIGYPDYNFSDTTSLRPSNLPGDSLKRFFGKNGPALLPGTLIEIEESKKLLESKGVSSSVYSHRAATESLLKTAQSPTILHIATHGFFFNSESSNMHSPILAGLSSSFVRQNPMIRSGLLLAGSGLYLREGRSSNEDGIHTAFEASSLNLDETRLVVLSACETGLGEVKNGEGVYGLQRAFAVAGAKSVLMSLWKVDDKATQELMVNFYGSWNTNESPADAFYAAVKRLREKYVQPYYWGAFVLTGM